MVDVGSGPPLVLIPGLQGRWEWMQPTVEALSAEFRVVSSSLPGEPGSLSRRGGESSFEAYVTHIDGVLDAAGISSAVLCGVSFGGLIALRYAARRGERVRALILVSTPGPRWSPPPNLARYLKWPTLSSPLFAAGAVGRFWREVSAIYPARVDRLAWCASMAWRVASAPGIPRRMSRRARLAEAENFEGDCACVGVPTLVVTGEQHLDRVVPCAATMQYLTLISGARYHRLERTGHMGTVLAPGRFAAIVSEFLNDRQHPG